MTTAPPLGEVKALSVLEVDGVTLDRALRWVIHSALLAQVDDMHAGGVYAWTDVDVKAAERALAVVTGTLPGVAPEGYGSSLTSRVITLVLLVPLYDLDHPDLEPEEWAEAERLIGLLEVEFGR